MWQKIHFLSFKTALNAFRRHPPPPPPQGFRCRCVCLCVCWCQSLSSSVISSAPLIALITFIKHGGRAGVQTSLLWGTDAKRIVSRPFHYWFSPSCGGAKMSSFGWLYFLIIYTSEELFTGFVSHLSVPLSIHLYRSHLCSLSGLSHSNLFHR